MRVEGRCHCGAISYEAVVDPARVTICHCSDCQMLSGSAYRVTVPTSKEDLVLLAGQPKVYIKTADSGARRAHSFCGDCGAPVHSAAKVDPKSYSLRVGCLAQRAELVPVRQQWCQSSLPWAIVGATSSLPSVEQVPRQ